MCDTLLVANPTAQSGAARELIERARALLRDAGVGHRFLPTEPLGGTIESVRRAVDERPLRRVIMMGGDGTFAEVAKGILRSSGGPRVALGMLPMGTANDQGKSFGLEAGAEALHRNVDVIAAGHVRPIDVGQIRRLDERGHVTHSDMFFDAASIGFSAAVLRTRNEDREAVADVPVLRDLYRDQLVYTGAALKHLFDSYVVDAKFDLEAELDGERVRYRKLLDVIVKNTPVFGGEWILDDGASPDDGRFELVPIAGRRDLTSKLLANLRGLPFTERDLRKIGVEHSRPRRARSMKLTVLQPGRADAPAVQIDGEEFPAGECFAVDVLPRALRLIVP